MLRDLTKFDNDDNTKPMTIRVAAVQFASGTDQSANLATCLRLLDRAAEVAPALVVLPEFCNRLSWYAEQAEVYDSALTLDGPFLQAIAARARAHAMHVVINVTMRRANLQTTVTSLLFDDTGQCVAEYDKQTLMGHENRRFARATRPAPVATLPFGRIGMYACRDGVTMETPRSLAIDGAQILCNSLNSFAFDEADLHIPVRAPENKVFVVSANKVGPLIPEHLLAEMAPKLGVPARYLYGAGESQIVAPDGRVLAQAPRSGEALIWADIDPTQADDKCRPDGTDIMATRRGSLYRPIAQPPAVHDAHPAADRIRAAVFVPQGAADPVEQACAAVRQLAADDVALLVLPELFCFAEGVISDPLAAARQSQAAIAALSAACAGSDLLVCTSLVEQTEVGALAHVGVLIGADGVCLRQPQLHRSLRHRWATPSDAILTADTGWGRVGILVGSDSVYPEIAKVLAIAGVDVLCVPFHAQEAWETRLGLVDRSAENRVCLVAATRPTAAGNSLMVTQWADFQIFTPWQQRQFNGTINEPIVTRASADQALLTADIHPATARFKTMSADTDLIQGRAWQLAHTLTDHEDPA